MGITDAFSQLIEVEGHLIDSMILTKILDAIMDLQGSFEILEFNVGKRKEDQSYARIDVYGESQEHLDSILSNVFRFGATVPETLEVSYSPAPRDMVLPDDFYSTTHHSTSVYIGGRWVEVEELMMDKQIVVDPITGRVRCKPIRLVEKGDLVVTGERGIRIRLPERPREGMGIFEFMTSDASSEKPSTLIIKNIAEDLRRTSERGGKIVVVAGPAVVHTGASPALAKMIQMGYVDAILAGNALAVHDVECALFGTSLGVELGRVSGRRESRNHIAAINEVMKAGSMKLMVEKGKLDKGIFYQLIVNNIPFALASSIRDDGPIPEVIQSSVEAQSLYRELVRDADYVVMLASTLHSIAVGNMLSSRVKIACVDINPAVVTKLSDRGTSQAIGVVTDVGPFLSLLVEALEKSQAPA
ncbi:MAG: TIGR00300 family protein [Candidatus Bathyarchaeota archaeon]|nr:TIGR00300 family protein [Candidatus Bathyarchaeota archaeon]MDP7443780.1 TIGR00300 family protein [Candidatus Bathyarchaeota archaeon]